MITIDDALNYLGIDYGDDDMIYSNVARAISAADMFMKGAVGTNYPADDPRAEELMLIVVADLYDNRGIHDKVSGSVRRLVQDFALQLRLDLRK